MEPSQASWKQEHTRIGIPRPVLDLHALPGYVLMHSQPMHTPWRATVNAKLFSGTLEMLILEVVADGPTYGYEITQTVLGRSDGRFELTEGSLYPALHRLERKRLLKAKWRDASGRRRKYYEVTPAGARELEARRKEWDEFVSGVEGVLGGADGLA